MDGKGCVSVCFIGEITVTAACGGKTARQGTELWSFDAIPMCRIYAGGSVRPPPQPAASPSPAAADASEAAARGHPCPPQGIRMAPSTLLPTLQQLWHQLLGCRAAAVAAVVAVAARVACTTSATAACRVTAMRGMSYPQLKRYWYRHATGGEPANRQPRAAAGGTAASSRPAGAAVHRSGTAGTAAGARHCTSRAGGCAASDAAPPALACC